MADGWKENAKQRQQKMCELFMGYDWLLFKKNEREYLKKKIEYILFGPNSNNLNEEAMLIIKKIFEQILKEGNRGNCSVDETCMAFIYIFWVDFNDKDLKSWPVFKVPKDRESNHANFIDINSRVYSSWNDFLKNNKFPPCQYCYPSGGKYITDENGEVLINYGKSPSASLSNNIVKYIDYANAGLALGTTVVFVAACFLPVAGPLLQSSVWLTRGICAYTTMRSGSTLVDRSTHKQSISLRDGESRNCWLSIGGSVLGTAASSAQNVTSNLTRSGQVVGKFGCATVNTLKVGSFAVNGLGLMNSFHCLINEYKITHKVNTLDVIQFSASVLLFAHATVNFETAKTIIEKTQNNVLQDFESTLRSNRHRKMFRRVVKNTQHEMNVVEGNAQVIRTLTHIKNVDDFFSALARMDKQFKPTGSRATFTEGGFININQNLPVDPTKLVQVTPEQRIRILEATKQFAGNVISEVEFKGMTESIIGKASIPTLQGPQLGRAETLKNLFRLGYTGNRPNIGSEFSYPVLSAYEKMDLIFLLKKFAESDHEQILQIVTIVVKVLGLPSEIMGVASFVCGLIRSVARDSRTCTNARPQRTNTELCQAALHEFMNDPSKLIEIFKHVKILFEVLQERSTIPTRFHHVGLYEIAQLTGVLIAVDEPLWHRLITFAQQIFHILGLKKPEKIINVLKGLCLHIEHVLNDIDRNQYYSTSAMSLLEPTSKEISWNHCSIILNTLNEDDEIRTCLIEKIRRDISENVEESPDESNKLKYTEQQPLIINRSFQMGDEFALSEEEILDLCRKCLGTEMWLTDCNIERTVTKIFVNIDDMLVVIECNFDEGNISVYVSTAATL